MKRFIVLGLISLLATVALFNLSTVPPGVSAMSSVQAQQQVKSVVISSLKQNLQPKASQPTIRKVAIISPYALATWTVGEMGGQTLLKQTQAGWVIVTSGGGALGVDGLIQYGVPKDISESLWKSLNY